MKRIKLYAFFGNNLGDDLMVHILLTRYPKYKFYYDGGSDPSDIFLKYSNFENRTTLFRKYGRLNQLLNIVTGYKKTDFFFNWLFRKKSKQCCCGILIGGSMFMQLKAAPERQVWWEELRFGDLPRFAIGVNFGPYQTEDFREAFDGYFQRCKGVTFRDTTSYNLFKHHVHTAYAPDVVLNLPIKGRENQPSIGKVIISVIHAAERQNLVEMADDYERFIVDCCRACICRGKTPVLMSFCKQEGDEVAIQKIQNRLTAEEQEKTEIFHYAENLDEALDLFAESEFVIATRFHAMILALRFRKPFFSIAYSDKVKWVLDDIDSKAYCSMQALGNLDAGSILDTHSQCVDVQDYIRKAAHQFDQFERFMKQE